MTGARRAPIGWYGVAMRYHGTKTSSAAPVVFVVILVPSQRSRHYGYGIVDYLNHSHARGNLQQF